jgi:class 3 adenylate cyclase
VYLRPLLGQTSPVPDDRSERKLATVLFADLVGSTAAADEQDPERTRARLERFYDAMTAEIEAAGGTIEKFAGDAVMAAFGAPEALEDHAERALHAALSMQRRLEGGLALRIGVNTGEVVVGRPREGSSFVSGDAVNVAARLEQAAEPGEILAGERTVAAVRGAFEFAELSAVQAKGKSEGVGCRRVVRSLSLMRTRGVGGFARAFVGRDEELDRLHRAYRRAVDRSRPVLVTIVGDAGVGKTRLMRELWEQLADESPEPLRRTGRCLAYGQGITYWPLAEVLKEHLSILESDSPEEVRRRLGEREILGVTLGLDVAGELHPLAARDRLHQEWVSFLSELTRERPAVLLVEDVHWAEQPLLDLIERLARDVRGPLLLLTTARPDFVDGHAGWHGRIDNETVWLEPLSEENAGSLVDRLAGALPASVRDLVVERAEGNPFFVEEVLGGLIDAGVLKRENGSWRATEPSAGFQIPDSVQAVLAARIDLLGEAEKEALQAAAVIGRVFWTGPVYELVEGLEPDFNVLESRDLIRQRSPSSFVGEVEYVFKHALTREVAYRSVTKARRARLHAAFAEWIERMGEGRDEHAPLLAHHYAEAVRSEDVDLAWADDELRFEGLRRKAVHWLRRAADTAISRYSIDDGIALLHRAVELEPDPTEQGRIWREIGRASALKFDGESFIEAMERSLALVEDPQERGNTYSELSFHTSIRSGMWRRRPVDEVVDRWIEQALELTDPDGPPRVRALLALAHWHPERGDDVAREAGVLAERLGDPELRSYAWAARAYAAFRDARPQDVVNWALRRFDIEDEITDPDHLVEIRETASPAVIAVGRLREARRLAAEHVELSRELPPHHRMHAISLVAEMEEAAGNWSGLIELDARIEQAASDNRDTPCVRNARSTLLCAVAHAYAGDPARADELERAANSFGMEGHLNALVAPRIRLALARGQAGKLERFMRGQEAFLPQTARLSFGLASFSARLDALAALRDRDRVESEAPAFLEQGMYLEPFALRALGIVREDDTLVAEANTRFRALRLDGHADQTAAIRSFPS